ncbi:MAG: hypothetical protein ACFFD2_09005 [Promethearchaeota archaeon]
MKTAKTTQTFPQIQEEQVKFHIFHNNLDFDKEKIEEQSKYLERSRKQSEPANRHLLSKMGGYVYKLEKKWQKIGGLGRLSHSFAPEK